MPVFNSRGQILAGVGAQGHIDGVVFSSRVSCCVWLTDDIVLYNGVDDFGRWALYSYDQSTGKHESVNPSGANFIVASKGRYASQASGVLTGNFNFNKGSVMSLCGTDNRGKSNRDGLICLCNDPSCQSFAIYSDWHTTLVNNPAYGLFPVNTYSAIWDNNSAYGIELVLPINLINMKLVTLTDGDWIVGWNDKYGLVALMNRATNGYILNSNPTSFHVDALNLNDQLYVCWSLTPGEGLGDIVPVIVNRNAPRVSFIDNSISPPIDHPNPPIPPKPPIIIPPIVIPPIVKTKDLIMQFTSFDTSKGLIPVASLKQSSQAGCMNLIFKNGEVFSAQGDTRPSGSDGPWEQGQVSGNVVTYTDGTKLYSYGFVMVDKLPE